MRFETRQVRVGEWLGDVPRDWDWEAFRKKFLSTRAVDDYNKSAGLFEQMAEAIERGAEVTAYVSGGFGHKVLRCGLYDGWPFWEPRPCYRYKGPIPAEHIDEFYNLQSIKIEEKE